MSPPCWYPPITPITVPRPVVGLMSASNGLPLVPLVYPAAVEPELSRAEGGHPVLAGDRGGPAIRVAGDPDELARGLAEADPFAPGDGLHGGIRSQLLDLEEGHVVIGIGRGGPSLVNGHPGHRPHPVRGVAVAESRDEGELAGAQSADAVRGRHDQVALRAVDHARRTEVAPGQLAPMGDAEQRPDGVGRWRRMTGPDRGLMCCAAEALHRGSQPDRQARAVRGRQGRGRRAPRARLPRRPESSWADGPGRKRYARQLRRRGHCGPRPRGHCGPRDVPRAAPTGRSARRIHSPRWVGSEAVRRIHRKGGTTRKYWLHTTLCADQTPGGVWRGAEPAGMPFERRGWCAAGAGARPGLVRGRPGTDRARRALQGLSQLGAPGPENVGADGLAHE